MLYLYHNDMSVCAQKVRMVLAHKELDWEGSNLNLRAGEQFAPDFLKVSPKGLVPVLVHDDAVILESNAIVQYLDEVFPESPLMSPNAVERAQIRGWLIRLDAGLHEQLAVISFCVAFRHQLLQRHATSESLQVFFEKISDPSRRTVMEDIVTNGLESPRLRLAALAYKKLIGDMATALADSEWLVGGEISLADFAMLPYIERLEQLQLSGWWAAYPQLDQWLARLRTTQAYLVGINEWSNPSYIQLMNDSGAEAWPHMKALLG
ncbi:MAG: glutathione S-transferase family protein [Haliea sp.]|uniref:glutathione S-transferase family protein n=1 Tax=Haliea sp. TaxID=1932666 RepID=UPI0032ED55F5